MTDRSLLSRILYPGPALEAKAYPATGITFVGPDTATLSYPLDRNPFSVEQLTRQTAFGVSALCYTAMLWRASRMAAAPLIVVRETDDGDEWQRAHPLAPLLGQPRPDIRMGELLERSQMYRDHTGGCLWVIERDRAGRPLALTPYSGDEFESHAEGDLIYGRYRVLRRGGGWRDVPREDAIHFRETNPASWRRGLSKVDAALVQLDLGQNVDRIVHTFLRKAMFPGGVISPDPEWQPTEAEWKTWKAQVEAWWLGPAMQGRPLIVPGKTTVSAVSTGMRDLLPEPIMDRVEATVGAVFGTPPVVLGWLSGMKNSPWSQMAEARRQTYEDTIEPLWHGIEAVLTMALLSPEEQASGLVVRFDTSRIRALMSDAEQQARIGALASDVLKVNERRVMLGRDPLPKDDERGEIIAGLPGAVAEPADELGAGDDPPVDDPPADDEAVDDEPEDDEVDEETLGKAHGLKAGADTKDLLWLLYDLGTKAAEPSYQRVVYSQLQLQKAAIVRLAEKLLSAKAEPSEESARRFAEEARLLLKREQARFASSMYPLLVRTGTSAVKRLAARLDVTFALLEPGLLSYAKNEAAFLARVMGKTTGEAVARAVQKGLAEGETIGALTKRLAGLAEFDLPRAKLTARTETTRAWNGAQRQSLSDYERRSGKKAVKSWLSSRDQRVRDEHELLDDGSWIGIDSLFANGLQGPGEPNCRCTLLYGFDDSPLGDTQP